MSPSSAMPDPRTDFMCLLFWRFDPSNTYPDFHIFSLYFQLPVASVLVHNRSRMLKSILMRI
jgi:hypothetical protein